MVRHIELSVRRSIKVVLVLKLRYRLDELFLSQHVNSLAVGPFPVIRVVIGNTRECLFWNE